MNIHDAEATFNLQHRRLDDSQHRFDGHYPVKRRHSRPKQLDRNRVVGNFHRGIAVHAKMGGCIYHICACLHVEYERRHLNLLWGMDKRCPRRR